MYIIRAEVEKILEVMDEYPEANSFRLEQSRHSGIGSVLTLVINTELKGREVEVKVEISGVENW